MIHLHAIPQLQRGAVLVTITPDEQALELERMLLGLGHKNHDLWSQHKTLAAIKAYLGSLNGRMTKLSRTKNDKAEAEHFGPAARVWDEDGISGLQSFLADQLAAGSATDRYRQGQDLALKFNQADQTMQ